MSTETNTSSGGVGFFGLLFIVFLVLKLTHVIDWSWWWVTSPLWLPTSVGILVLAIGFVIYTIAKNSREKADERKRQERIAAARARRF